MNDKKLNIFTILIGCMILFGTIVAGYHLFHHHRGESDSASSSSKRASHSHSAAVESDSSGEESGSAAPFLAPFFNHRVLFLSQIVIAVMFVMFLLRIKTLQTDLKRKEEEISRTEEASQAKRIFLASMSHEIRTPLNGILGLTELSLQNCREEEMRKHLELITSETDFLLSIVNEILDFSKIEAGKMVLDKIPFDMSTLVSNVLEGFGLRAESKGLYLKALLSPNMPTRVCADPGRIRQILVNLIGNALKFTHQGGITVELEPLEVEEEELTLLISVHDTGIGIPEQKQKEIFESFTQADSSTSTKYGGTGLGITLCKQFVELMEGEMGLESEENKGSVFWFTLKLARQEAGCATTGYGTPLENTDAVAATPRSVKAGEIPSLPIPYEEIRVLLAEDYPTNQRVATSHLESKGYQVFLAENGKEAVEIYQRESIDLVLMDVQMPEMNGYDATREIRRLQGEDREDLSPESYAAELPILALTAHATTEMLEQCLEAGANAILTKPLRKKEFLETVEKWLREKYCNQESSLELVGG